jgi:cobalt-zinc-cadmium efflux system protein
MAYHAWGNPHNPKVLVCVHGLTRRGSDFKTLAEAMSHDYYVVCPDVVGRGDSDRLKNPMLYAVPQYVADMANLIGHLGVVQVDWFGTSMGGLIGMVYAAMPKSPIRRMLINDVGPRIEPEAIKRLALMLDSLLVFLIVPMPCSASMRSVHLLAVTLQKSGRFITAPCLYKRMDFG